MTGVVAPLSIGIVSPALSRTGGGIFPIVRAHARGLASRAEADVTLYGIVDAAAKDDAPSLGSVRTRTYWPLVRAFGYSPGLSSDLLRSAHDVVHQHGLWLYPSIAVSRWRRRTRKPTVISTQGMLEPWAVANSAAKKRLAASLFERENLERAACLHCSEAEVAGVRAFGLKNPIAVIPNGMDLPESKPSPARPGWMPASRKTLLFMGRIHPKKGIDELLYAWSQLTQAREDLGRSWLLAIAGWDDGGHAARIVDLARRLGLDENRVVFPGPVFGDEKEAALRHAHAFILPSHSEGFPMTVLEAWSFALPVLMTAACNIPEGFRQGAAIEISLDPGHLARQIAASLDRSDLAEIGERGRHLTATHFNWDSVVERLLSVYRWIHGAAPRPPFVVVD